MASVVVGIGDVDVEIEYTDTGSGPVLVFVHGAYVTGRLWQDVVDRLSDGHRCIAPTLPFGAQAEPVGANVDLTVAASGRLIVDLLEALDLSDVTLVANDTGGGIVLAALGNTMLNWDRVSKLVFTNCDSFEHFPPSSFVPIVRLCALNQTLGSIVLKGLTTAPGLKVFTSAVTLNGIDAARRPAIFGGFLTSAAVRARGRQVHRRSETQLHHGRGERGQAVGPARADGVGDKRQDVSAVARPTARRDFPQRFCAHHRGQLDLRHAGPSR